ncbi:MAG: ketoacyl-ACP synthase III [Lachnospiraceae bacterium]|nr:ketoacyl-ACP synthase III [Lachnospiraceae bacterium]MDD7626798.1 ketoacyl-ACP synthase III [Lachnospiraceae bacterium]MDY4118516.1 beta-ketoacyl-ACP synthase III [Lachnospiraceae bacterium]
MPARIIGTGSALPALLVSNRELEKIVDTTDEWIRSRTGIESRHIAVEETTTSMAIEAAKKALQDAKASPEELDLIIVGTISPDHYFPSTACEIQSALGAVNATAFDISAACAGFLFGLGIVDAYMKADTVRTALVVGAETLSKMMDWNDRSTCVLFGDGAGAAVVRSDESGIMSMVQGSDGARGNALTCEGRRVNNPYKKNDTSLDYTKMNGQEVYKFAVKTVPKSIEEALLKADVKADDVKYFLLHQANLRIIEAVAKRLGQSIEKFPTNLQECGNISAGSVPVLLDHVNREGMLQKGDTIVLAGFGAGLTWGATVLIW